MLNQEKANTSAVMRCETCHILIKCGNLAEAEQRAKIHINFTKDIHIATWNLEVETDAAVINKQNQLDATQDLADE
jgi:hypothetical protein